ncbi:MAG: hypothetical protein AAGJ08_12150 [Cyanobacteria bacterium P01_H01_bin.35]
MITRTLDLSILKAMNNEKLSKNPGNGKFSITLGQLMVLPLILVPIIFIVNDYVRLRYRVQQLEDKLKTTDELTERVQQLEDKLKRFETGGTIKPKFKDFNP